MDQLLMTDVVAFSILSFQPVEYDTVTVVVTVRTSGQHKSAVFWFQLGTNFLGSKPTYFWSKCSRQFKIRCVNWNGTSSMLVEKGYQWA